MQNKQLPEIGKEYHFFDDGKVGPSRHYIARVEKLIPYSDFYATKIKTNEDEDRLLDIWKREINEHDWLFNKETDYAVVCSIPTYDKDLIYFVRTRSGGWFSMNVTNWWQGGRLDVDGDIYESIMEEYEDKPEFLSLYSMHTYRKRE